MTGKAKKALLIVITRTHTPKGNEHDEYVTYWNGKLDEAGKLDTNFLDICDFLLVHGHSGMQDNIEAAIENVLERKFSDWEPMYCFIHAREEYRKKIKIPNIRVYGYGSRGTNLAPQDLLKQIKIKIKEVLLSNDINRILYKIKEKLRGFRYKQHLLNQVKERLLQLRFNLEVFACESDNTFRDEASKDIISIVANIRKNLEDPPLLLCPMEESATPKSHDMFVELDSSQRLITFFCDLEGLELLCAKKVWESLFPSGPSSETLSMDGEAQNELGQIPKDFEKLSQSIEAILGWIKSNSDQGA